MRTPGIYDVIPWLFQPAKNSHHLHRRLRGMEAFIVRTRNRAGERLLIRICGEDTESDRNSCLQSNLADSESCSVADVFEVRGLATKNTTERDDGVETAGQRRMLGCERNFECARDVNHRHVRNIAQG